MAKTTVHDVLMAIGEMRKLTCHPREGSNTLSIEQLFEVDNMLIVLEDRLLDDYGDTSQTETF